MHHSNTNNQKIFTQANSLMHRPSEESARASTARTPCHSVAHGLFVVLPSWRSLVSMTSIAKAVQRRLDFYFKLADFLQEDKFIY
jgi:hypothetical protein